MSTWTDKQNRLQQILGMLRSDTSWTCRSLAESLNISLRTLNRDLDLLREQGIPIESSRGKGGGVALSGRFGMGRLNLSDVEILNLIMSITITEQLKLPFMAEHLNPLRHKLSLFLTDAQRAQVNKLRKRILVGRPASEPILATFNSIEMAMLEDVKQAFFQRKTLWIRYQSEHVTERIIEPQILVLNWPVWYLVGWDHLRSAPRMFRVDRICDAKLQNQPFNLRPERQLTDGFGHLFASL